MLVLTRKQHEQIFVGDDITVTVCRIDGDSVRVGITAPENVQIVRDDAVQKTPSPNRVRGKSQDQEVVARLSIPTWMKTEADEPEVVPAQ